MKCYGIYDDYKPGFLLCQYGENRLEIIRNIVTDMNERHSKKNSKKTKKNSKKTKKNPNHEQITRYSVKEIKK